MFVSRVTSAASAGRHGLVLGSGSNVIDAFFHVMKLPLPGEKTYFSKERFQTGLLALQGSDANGTIIRAKMLEMGVSTEFVRVADDYVTSVSHVLIEEGTGERTILMAPASTSQLTGQKMQQEFHAAVEGASMVTTEISQLPLSGVEYLLDSAKRLRIPSLLDVDVTPSIATGAARLGSMDELRRCVRKAGVLKLTATAASELLSLVSTAPLAAHLEGVAEQLVQAFDANLCVVTDGSRGSALALHPRIAKASVRIPICEGVTQRDATGAGDAFFGGVVAAVHRWGLPTDSASMLRVGKVAAAAGAACVEVLGALPIAGTSDQRMVALNSACHELVQASPLPKLKVGTPSSYQSNSLEWWRDSLSSDLATLHFLRDAYANNDAAVQRFRDAISDLCICSKSRGHIYVSGIGKSSAVALRISLSLRSIGLPSSFVHGNEFHHGDLGTLRAGDVVLLLSNSGSTIELLDVAKRAKLRGCNTIALTSTNDSALASACDRVLVAPCIPDILGKIPSRSIISQEAVGNMLVQGMVNALKVDLKQFHVNHPGGAIGADALASNA